jgi:hypothetical protein
VLGAYCQHGGNSQFAIAVAKAVAIRLVNLWPNDRLDELMPWAWAAAREQHQPAA